MKSLKEFIIESCDKCKDSETREFVFDFSDITNGEETVKSLQGMDNVTVDGNKVKLNICKDCDIDTVQDILQQAIQAARSEQQNKSNETYAQKTAKLEKTLKSMYDFIDSEDEEDPEDKKEEE